LDALKRPISLLRITAVPQLVCMCSAKPLASICDKLPCTMRMPRRSASFSDASVNP
jgi:hypothetical protein